MHSSCWEESSPSHWVFSSQSACFVTTGSTLLLLLSTVVGWVPLGGCCSPLALPSRRSPTWRYDDDDRHGFGGFPWPCLPVCSSNMPKQLQTYTESAPVHVPHLPVGWSRSSVSLSSVDTMYSESGHSGGTCGLQVVSHDCRCSLAQTHDGLGR
ncbi:hypothetical protein LZ30DRAFT_142850 [Colletotrichum cereale]|nr:hypothetical protein LZ30DRAFT_142850 [Colletotrichum cereale]